MHSLCVCWGCSPKTLALVWLQDKHSTWKSVLEGVPLGEVTDLRAAIPGLTAGEYQVDWWNTYTGQVVQQTQARADSAGLQLEVPRFTRDIAAVIRRVAKPSGR